MLRAVHGRGHGRVEVTPACGRRFRDRPAVSWEGQRGPTPTAVVNSSQTTLQAELEEELRQAEEDFARGDFIELTVEELDRCRAAREWPWQREFSE